jgi:uncharacterized protein HemX
MNPQDNQPVQATPVTNSKSGALKAVIAAIIIAAIAAGAYYVSTRTDVAESDEMTQEELPALSESDEVDSIEADLESTVIFDEDLSSFEAELEATQ